MIRSETLLLKGEYVVYGVNRSSGAWRVGEMSGWAGWRVGGGWRLVGWTIASSWSLCVAFLFEQAVAPLLHAVGVDPAG